jgi:hypothetical protein
MGYVMLWLFMGLLGAALGNSKGRGGDGFCLGVLLGPIGVVIVVLLSPKGRVCSFCKSSIHSEASVCPHCQREQPKQESSSDDDRMRQVEESTKLF